MRMPSSIDISDAEGNIDGFDTKLVKWFTLAIEMLVTKAQLNSTYTTGCIFDI